MEPYEIVIREEQIWLHIRSFSCTLTLVLCGLCLVMLACLVCTLCKRMLPIAWNIQDSLFSGLWLLRVHSYRDKKLQKREKYLSCWRFAGTLWPDLCGQLQEQRIPAPRSLQQLTTLLPHLAFKNALLKPFEEFFCFVLFVLGRSHPSPCMALQ